MARNYEKENQWRKEKYIRFETRLDTTEFNDIVTQIKEKIGVSSFVKKAIKLYESNPELFEE